MHSNILIYFFLIFYHQNSINANTIDKHFLDRLSLESIDDWFDTVNVQYESLLRYSSYVEWELLVNPSDDLVDKGYVLNAIKLKWRNLRCSESEQVLEKNVNNIQKRMIYLLCRGPKFTDYEAKELSKVLNHMSDVYSSTRVCLPKHFDVCKNMDRIWEFTFMKSSTGSMYPLILDGVKPKGRGGISKDAALSKLHFWDGKFDDDYFLFDDEENVELFGEKISFLCFSGEPELERIMEGGEYTKLHHYQTFGCFLLSNFKKSY